MEKPNCKRYVDLVTSSPAYKVNYKLKCIEVQDIHITIPEENKVTHSSRFDSYKYKLTQDIPYILLVNGIPSRKIQ